MELSIKNEKLVAHFEAERNSPQPPVHKQRSTLRAFSMHTCDNT